MTDDEFHATLRAMLRKIDNIDGMKQFIFDNICGLREAMQQPKVGFLIPMRSLDDDDAPEETEH